MQSPKCRRRQASGALALLVEVSPAHPEMDLEGGLAAVSSFKEYRVSVQVAIVTGSGGVESSTLRCSLNFALEQGRGNWLVHVLGGLEQVGFRSGCC